MELLTPGVGLIFWQLVIFISLFFLLKKFAWKGILSALKAREDEIDSALKMAEETRAEMAKLKSDNEKLIAEARKERDVILAEARETANRMVTTAESKAKEQGSKILEEARESMTTERTAMIAEVKKEVASISIGIAEKLLKKELSDKKAQESLVSELLVDAKLN